jgi:hypothetical protein
MNKKFVFINTILTFAIGFLVHNIYKWLPSTITTIFPVNESLFEHMKLIFISPIISSLIIYLFFRKKDKTINNYLFGLIVSIIFNIIIFYLVYLPLYYSIGQSMFMTLSIYFVTLVMSNFLYYLIIEMKNNSKLNIISFIMLLVIGGVLTYFTYHPIKIDFFRDPTTNVYGIPK